MALDNKKWGKTLNVKAVHAFEQLSEIDKETEPNKKMDLLHKYGGQTPLSFLLSLNFRKDITLDLPEGMPPLDPKELDAVTHPDLAGNLASSIHRLKNCTPKSTLKNFKKEEIFVEVLLACPLKDAEILCSAKDKALMELYPTITANFVKAVFPNYVS